MKKIVSLILGILLIVSLTACSKGNTEKIQNSIEEVQNQIAAENEANDIKIAEDNSAITEELVEQNIIDISTARFVNEGKLTVGMVVDYPPFEYYSSNGNVPIGVDVDIVTNIAKKLGLELEIKDVPWDDNLFINIGSEYDVVCSAVTITEERKAEMIFSNSYIDNYQSVVVKADNSININSFNDLNGLKVAVQKGTVSNELMNELIGSDSLGESLEESFNIELFENDVATDCFEQLLSGQVDAIVCDSTVTDGQVARNSEMLKEAYRDESEIEQFAIAIGKDNEGLQAAINEAIAMLEDEGTSSKIINSWFSK